MVFGTASSCTYILFYTQCQSVLQGDLLLCKLPVLPTMSIYAKQTKKIPPKAVIILTMAEEFISFAEKSGFVRVFKMNQLD